MDAPAYEVQSTPPPLLNASGLIVDYPGARALDRASFTLAAGEIHALMGENGAGKSTLVKVLSGLLPTHGGTVFLCGKEIRPSSPREAQGEVLRLAESVVPRCGHAQIFGELCHVSHARFSEGARKS